MRQCWLTLQCLDEISLAVQMFLLAVQKCLDSYDGSRAAELVLKLVALMVMLASLPAIIFDGSR